MGAGMILRWGGRFYLMLVMMFILAPALVVLVDSVNAATSFPSPFEGATLRWYAELSGHREFLQAAWISLQVALIAAALASVAGFLAAYALARSKMRGRDAIATALMGPLLVPELVVGLAILQVIGLTGLSLGLPVLIAAHCVFVLPLTLRLVLAGFSRFDFDLEAAARSMGANGFQILVFVTLPLLKPSVLAGFILSAVLSFVNLPLSMFLTTAQTATLPVIAFAYMESRIDPMIAAVATLVMVIAACVAICIDRILRVRIVE
jgi:putative spermidine/putrescine transport system permease protein